LPTKEEADEKLRRKIETLKVFYGKKYNLKMVI
jgi:hypothetical protein